MKQFKLVNNVLGWVAFLIAAFVYCSTIEPTASFWDCPEFIVTGYKLEVGLLHAHGQPFLAVRQRPDAGGTNGEHHECLAFGYMHSVPFLEHHAPDTQADMGR